MASLNDLIEQRSANIDKLPNELFGAIEKAQRDVMRQVSILINQLETNASGQVILNTKNIALIEQIGARANDVLFGGSYIDAVRDFAGSLEQQGALAAEYMTTAFGTFDDKRIFQQVLRQSQLDVLALLDEQAVNQALIEPLKSALRDSVTSGARLTDVIQSVQQIVVGNEQVESNLLGNRKTLVRDTFAASDRRYQKTIESQYSFDFYRYSGSLVSDSRCFCQERQGKYYHKREIESWGALQNLGKCRTSNGWQGRRKGTTPATIFTYAGGYNCDHVFAAVPIEAVPPSAIQRARGLGYLPPEVSS